MGKEQARRWRSKNAIVPPDANATMIAALVVGTVAANHFAICNKLLKPQIQQAPKRFTARDYFGFDPVAEPPPNDVAEDCQCGPLLKVQRRRCNGHAASEPIREQISAFAATHPVDLRTRKGCVAAFGKASI